MQESTGRYTTPIEGKTHRLESFSSLNKTNRIIQRHSSYDMAIAEKLARYKAVADPENIIIKQVTEAIKEKTLQLKYKKHLCLIKQETLCNTLQKEKNIERTLMSEEFKLMQQLANIGNERTIIKSKLAKLDTGITIEKHLFEDEKAIVDKLLSELQNKIFALQALRKNLKINLEVKRKNWKAEKNKFKEYKQGLEGDNRVLKSTIDELSDKRHLAMINECKRISELKNRMQEIISKNHC